ncbi:MAG: hypothetical protein RLZZ227_2221 [Pseudomonadota bacterium]|jgi:type IV pilus assembly protein PilE
MHKQLSGSAPYCAFKARGFTMTELLISMAIVGIIAAIALPSYQNATRRSNRTDAQITMARVATLQERYFFQNNSYAANFSDMIAGMSPGDALASDDGNYVVSLTLTGGGTGWSLTANAVGGQVNDLECAALTLTSLGAKTALDADANPSTECW